MTAPADATTADAAATTPALPPVQRCNSCRALIIWVVMVNDEYMPLDAQPSPDQGNVQVVAEISSKGTHRGYVIGRKSQAGAMRAAGVALHVHHRVSCPHASRGARTTTTTTSSSGPARTRRSRR